VGFDGTPGNLELFGNFPVVATLQQQLGDLLLARSEPDSLPLHEYLSPSKISNGLDAQTSRQRYSPFDQEGTTSDGPILQKFIACGVPR